MTFPRLFESSQLAVIDYCAEEVRRQQDGPLAVGWMLRAWNNANALWFAGGEIRIEDILRFGNLVTPKNSKDDFRHQNVRVGTYPCPDWQEVPRLMEQLLDAWNDGRITGEVHPSAGDVGPEEMFYYQFLKVHPLVDGNGRTAKILYNFLKGTLTKPVWPPDFFGGISNP